MKKIVSTILLLSFFLSPIAVFADNDSEEYLNTKTTKQIFGNGETVATVEITKELDEDDNVVTVYNTYFNHNDMLGSVNAISNISGNLVSAQDYYPYGGSRVSSGSYNSQRKYIGEIYDSISELNYLNARYYNSKQGQFISQDPQFWGEQNLMDPQSLNSYSYARNNPVMNRDVTGEYWETAFDAAMFALSLNDFKEKPSFGHGVGVALDGASILLPIPAIYGGIKHSADAAKFIKGINKADGVIDVTNGINKEELLFRAMKEGEDGLPIIRESSNGLGVRIDRDIPVDINGMVHPNTGGMSASPSSPNNLPNKFKSKNFGGTNNNPNWCISCSSLPKGLKFVPDSNTHGTIQPAYSMLVDEFKNLIKSTRTLWTKAD